MPRAVERGVGLCSQQAIIVEELLRKNGIPAAIVGLSGHVVVRAQVDPDRRRWWVLDADYGVVIPEDLATLERNPATIRQSYSRAGYSEEKILALMKIYGAAGNTVHGTAWDYSRRKYVIEEASYVLIWLIPFLMIAPSMRCSLRRRATARGNRQRVPLRRMGDVVGSPPMHEGVEPAGPFPGSPSQSRAT